MSYVDKINLFAGYSSELDALADEHKAKLYGLVWSYRSGVSSVCVLTKDRDTVFSITNGIGTATKQGDIYGVDLESVGTDKVRVYVDPRKKPDDPIILVGYYYNQDDVFYEYKQYYKDTDSNLAIRRFDASGNLLANETEGPATASDWKGITDLVDIATSNNIAHVMFKKGEKDQCYIMMRFDVEAMQH